MHRKDTQHHDVIIIGAGISGIAAAVQLQQSCPDKTFAVLEMRENVGGTWDLFRYPGVRSDSDMFTLGYAFKPWVEEKVIAPADKILAYLRETVDDFALAEHIRFEHRLAAAAWSSEDKCWNLSVETKQGPISMTTGFLYLGAGYYSYEGGYNPPLPGEEDFDGPIIHPQAWPSKLDYAGKRIAVLGSGATAATLIPNLAREAEKVVMVQRTPGYVSIESDIDEEAVRWREELGPEGGFRAARLRNQQNQQMIYRDARADPETFKKELFGRIEEIVGREFRERHFTPTYEPFDQRVCVVPNGDLFHAIKAGKADVVTGVIKSVTSRGLLMEDGEEVVADVIVKAFGLKLTSGGGAVYEVDGKPVRLADCWTYKGLAYSGVPNLFHAFGFFNASWTLRIELVNEYWCQVLRHMDDIGAAQVTPRLRPEDAEMTPLPFVADVTSGFWRRGFSELPRQGDRDPWVNPQNLALSVDLLADDPEDGVLVYEK